MPHLNLALLGPFQLTLEEPIPTRIESDKVRSLLAFLAVEYTRSHPRAVLAELLWPGQPEQAATANFRRVLANLRAVIGDRDLRVPHLHITRTTVQFDIASDAFVDVVRLLDLLKTPASASTWADNMEQVIALYRGPFLEGFTLPGCPEFEQWVRNVRSELERLVGRAHHDLADDYFDRGDIAKALALYKRCLQFDPFHEAVHQKIMLAYAAIGQRQDVWLHYETYKRQLQDELDAKPGVETTALYETLQAGQTVQIESPGRFETHILPPSPADSYSLVSKHFVGRKQELTLMQDCARKAVSNHGGILLIVGEGGSGKTTLLHEFARQLARAPQPWLVAVGASTALWGIGDPYQPVVDALGMLVAGKTSGRRSFPSFEILRLLREEAPDWASLALAGAARQSDPLLAARTATILAPTTASAEGGWQNNQARAPQTAFFDQLTRFLARLARHAPLLLALDNLHAADAGTLALIHHLVQRLNRSHVLIACAYRPGALALEQDVHGKFAGQVLHELRRHPSAVLVDLDQADGRRFIDSLLDRNPNRYDETFRVAFYRHTEGHALFTVEMVHTLTACGALSQDRDRRWVASDEIDWSALPPNIEALIDERMDRLSSSDRRLLEVACVQGDEFSAQVVAAVAHVDEQLAVERLNGALATTHRIVVPSNKPTNLVASNLCYRFRHHLFQTYLYDALDEGRRAWLHRAVGSALAEQYNHDRTASSVTPQVLAWHFTQAGEHVRAVEHLRAASQDAMAIHSYMTAVDLLTQALALTPPEDHGARFDLLLLREQSHALLRNQRARVQDVGELEYLAGLTQQPSQQLIAALRRAILAEETTRYWEAITAANAALKLAVAAGNLAAQVEAHLVAGRAHWWRSEISLAQGRYAQALRSAQTMETPALVMPCRLHVGIAAWSLGDLVAADVAFSELLKSATHPEQSLVRGGAFMGLGMVAYTRGEYGRAEGLLDTALSLAHQLHHPWLEGQVLLNQMAFHRESLHCADCLALYPQLLQHCKAIDDRWTATAAQLEAATFYVQLGAWEGAREIIEHAAATADELSALLLKLRLLLLRLRLALATREMIEDAEVDRALDMAQKLGVAALLAEAWLLSGLVQQRQGRRLKAAAALAQARDIAQGEASRRLLPEIVGAQAELALKTGDSERALACIAELVDDPPLLIEQAIDPSSLYMTCCAVLDAIGEPWAEQMLVRGRRLLAEQAGQIPDEALRQAFCWNIPNHRRLQAWISGME
ncbi:MAG: hypothetical protein BroJett021_19790 [Chloroflexota bacterium]|nr:MAG: hypothetical protein BroJett021_19790 [Chloroflexota bacterium]